VLRCWIDSREPDGSKRTRTFIIRRDPRDISVVYFFDPELNCYFEIPYRDTSRPALTLWELREARTRLKQQGVAHMDEDLIFQVYRKLRVIEEEASTATRKAHRLPMTDARTKAGKASLEVTPPAAGDSDDQIRPFEEIEPWP
jgi:putative transposase